MRGLVIYGGMSGCTRPRSMALDEPHGLAWRRRTSWLCLCLSLSRNGSCSIVVLVQKKNSRLFWSGIELKIPLALHLTTYFAHSMRVYLCVAGVYFLVRSDTIWESLAEDG